MTARTPIDRAPFRRRAALAALPFLWIAAPPASAEAAEAGTVVPGFTVLDDRVVDGVRQVSVHFNAGGISVPGALFLPSGDAAAPGVLLNHDGEGSGRDAIARRARDLARLGYVVLAPDYRSDPGSRGRARENAAELGDVLAAAHALAGHPRVSDERLAILGTSHGAFISMLAVMQEPKRFRCLAHASGAIDVPRVASKVRIPVLLQHGWKDAVVEIGDAMYLSAEMRRAGNGTARLREYSLLGHNLWFSEDATAFPPDEVAQARWAWEDLTAFLGTYMRAGRSSADAPDVHPRAKADGGTGPSGP